MSTLRGVLVFALVGAASAVVSMGSDKATQKKGGNTALRNDGFVRMLDFKHQLRVCNAYPLAESLDVFRGKEERLTADASMPYKTCRDFSSNLKAGDKLEFRIGEESGGTFSVSDLPNNDAVLLLVVRRHDTLSTAVSFESHVFADLDGVQVAVIDAYQGKAKSTPKIVDSAAFLAMGKDGKDKLAPRSEELRYNSVVAVSPGIYDVELEGLDGLEKSRSQLVALKHQSYVVLRTGVEAQHGPSFPQELVIFPHPNAAELRSAAVMARSPLPAAFAAAAAALLASLIAA